MSAIVTAPPIIIDATNPARGDSNGGNYFGPFVIGNNYYAVLVDNFSGGATKHLNVYKSTNQGQTWTSMDLANRPILNVSPEFDVILVGTTITVAYVIPSPNHVVRAISFDTITDTFGTVSADGPLAHSVKLAQFSNGDIIVWYLAGGSLCAFVILAGGVGGIWGTPTTIPNSKNDIAAVLIGANDVAQAFYFDLAAPGFNLFLRTITNLGVISAETNVLSSTFVANTNESSFPVGRISIWKGDFKVPYYNAAGHASIFTGTPYTAPVWDGGALVDNLPWGVNEQDSDGFTFIDSNGNLILFWNSEDTTNIAPVDQMYYAINTGTSWSAPVLFYDAVANPQLQDPTVTPDQQFLHTLSATRLANGNFVVITAMEENGFCAGYFLTGAGGGGGGNLGNVRLQIYDDGAGEYLFSAPFNSLVVAGSEDTNTGLAGGAIGPFILPSPLAVTKPGLMTIMITNVNAPLNTGLEETNNVRPFVSLVFAIPKKCRGQVPTINATGSGRKGVIS